MHVARAMGHTDMMRTSIPVLALAAMLVALIWSPDAEAHAIGLSTAEYSARGSSVVGKLAFARGEVAALAAGVDANR